MNDWISLEDKTPEVGDEVLIYIPAINGQASARFCVEEKSLGEAWIHYLWVVLDDALQMDFDSVSHWVPKLKRPKDVMTYTHEWYCPTEKRPKEREDVFVVGNVGSDYPVVMYMTEDSCYAEVDGHDGTEITWYYEDGTMCYENENVVAWTHMINMPVNKPEGVKV